MTTFEMAVFWALPVTMILCVVGLDRLAVRNEAPRALALLGLFATPGLALGVLLLLWVNNFDWDATFRPEAHRDE